MDTPLDEVRDRVGLRSSPPTPVPWPAAGTPPARTSPARPAEVARAGRYPAEELYARTRWFVTGTAVTAAVVAVTHGLLAGWLAHASGRPWSAARALVSWPSPAAQQVLAAAAAVALAGLAAATDGYRRVGRELSWPLLAATVAAVLGAAPVVVVVVVTAAVWTLIAVVVAALVILVLAA